MKQLFLSFCLTVAFNSTLTYSQSTCFNFNNPNTRCGAFPNTSLDYQNCFFQWFCENKNWLNIPSDSVCNYYEANRGKQSAFLTFEKTPWISNYFLFIHGGIATKWQSPSFNPKYYKYNPQTHTAIDKLVWSRIKSMTKDQINKLSPAEKLDIYLGYEDFKITKWELENRGPFKKDIADWEGYCNGVRAAGIFLPEPTKSYTVKSKLDSTISLTFYPTDLKALAIASCFYVTGYADVGNPTSLTVLPNPTVFDVSLRFLIGNNIYPILFDRFSDLDRIQQNTASNEIWNTTIIGYNRQVLSKQDYTSAEMPTAVKVWTISTTLNTIEDIDYVADFYKNSKQFIQQKDKKFIKSKIYKYKLYLDSESKILGGEWLGNYPNHIWFAIGEGTQYEMNYTTNQLELHGNENLDYKLVKELIEKANQN